MPSPEERRDPSLDTNRCNTYTVKLPSAEQQPTSITPLSTEKMNIKLPQCMNNISQDYLIRNLAVKTRAIKVENVKKPTDPLRSEHS